MKTAYNVALSDWFHPPEILDVDLSNWTGQAGETIRVKARDDVLVATIGVVITNLDDEILAQGEAIQMDEMWWEYNMTIAISGNAIILLSAVDLPGHTHTIVEEITL